MIKGIGVDIVEVGKFNKFRQNKELFLQILTSNEAKEAQKSERIDLHAATLFAIKESVLKALGCGLSFGSYWHDIQVTKRQTVRLSGIIQKLAIEKGISTIHCSHTQSQNHIAAMVILEG